MTEPIQLRVIRTLVASLSVVTLLSLPLLAIYAAPMLMTAQGIGVGVLLTAFLGFIGMRVFRTGSVWSAWHGTRFVLAAIIWVGIWALLILPYHYRRKAMLLVLLPLTLASLLAAARYAHLSQVKGTVRLFFIDLTSFVDSAPLTPASHSAATELAKRYHSLGAVDHYLPGVKNTIALLESLFSSIDIANPRIALHQFRDNIDSAVAVFSINAPSSTGPGYAAYQLLGARIQLATSGSGKDSSKIVKAHTIITSLSLDGMPLVDGTPASQRALHSLRASAANTLGSAYTFLIPHCIETHTCPLEGHSPKQLTHLARDSFQRAGRLSQSPFSQMRMLNNLVDLVLVRVSQAHASKEPIDDLMFLGDPIAWLEAQILALRKALHQQPSPALALTLAQVHALLAHDIAEWLASDPPSSGRPAYATLSSLKEHCDSVAFLIHTSIALGIDRPVLEKEPHDLMLCWITLYSGRQPYSDPQIHDAFVHAELLVTEVYQRRGIHPQCSICSGSRKQGAIR